MDALFSTENITIYNALFRLFLGLIAGGLIGLNREKVSRAAGFRTHILICTGSTLIMLISIYISEEFRSVDPSRIASQVVTGIGFLGAGAIIKNGDHIKGLTTAASIWISAAIGLAIGTGMFWISMIALAFVLLTLIILERLERKMFQKRISKILLIQLKQPNANLKPVEEILNRFHLKYEIQEFRQNSYLGVSNLEIHITVDNHFSLEDFINSFSALSNIQEVTVKSKL